MADSYLFNKVHTAPHRRRPIALSWDRSAQDIALRNSGIDPLGKVPWGTHISLFYETKKDLLETNIPFFKAAMEANEYGLWMIFDPISPDDAKSALRRGVPDFDRHLAAGDMEIVVGADWFGRGGRLDFGNVLRSWHRKLHEALATGHEGLRISGNTHWQQTDHWKDFCTYERMLDNSIAGQRMLMMCAYSLEASRARDILDVARSHQCAIARRRGAWEFLQVPSADSARREILTLNGDPDVLSKPFPGRELLTPRELLVLAQIVKGASSKAAARKLGISPRTVDFHRANVMQKLQAKNAADLVRLALAS